MLAEFAAGLGPYWSESGNHRCCLSDKFAWNESGLPQAGSKCGVHEWTPQRQARASETTSLGESHYPG